MCSAVPPTAATPPAVEPALYLRQALDAGDFTLGEVTRGVFSKRWILFAAQPLRADDGGTAAVGAVALALDLAAMRLVDDADALPAGAVAQIADERGLVLASSVDPDRLIGSRLDPIPWQALRLGGPAALAPLEERRRAGRHGDSTRGPG